MEKLIKIGKSKKGSALDLILIGGILLAFAMLVLLGFKFMSEFNAQIQGDADIPAEAKATTAELEGYYPGVIDNSFLLLAIGLSLGALILAALVRISPIFIVLFIITLILIIFMCGVFSNIYQEMAENAQLQTEADQLIFISNIMEYLPLIIGIIGGLLSIIMYKSWNSAQF